MSDTANEHHAFYAAASLQRYNLDDATIAVRSYGCGPHLVLIHGYPVHGYTWRKILPALASRYTCHVIDLPGFGDSEWDKKTDFSFTAQARRLNKLFNRLALNKLAIIAHDTGATIARLAAAQQPERIDKMVILNTEMPNHRPPWIAFYQVCAKLPLAALVFKALMQSKVFIRSPMGFKEFYSDPLRFKSENPLPPYLDPLLSSKTKMQGMLHYLKGIEWSVVDDLVRLHAALTCEILVLWGECDQTFPVDQAEAMQHQFAGPTEFQRIKNASLMPHEEQPEQVLKYITNFI